MGVSAWAGTEADDDMKIIRAGTPGKETEDMISECHYCGCVFTFGEHESESFSNNGGGHVYFTKCPTCKRDCTFDTGYPGDSDKDRELDRRVKEEHVRLRLI